MMTVTQLADIVRADKFEWPDTLFEDRADLLALLAEARAVLEGCRQVLVNEELCAVGDQPDGYAWCGACGVESSDNEPLSHRPDCVWAQVWDLLAVLAALDPEAG